MIRTPRPSGPLAEEGGRRADPAEVAATEDRARDGDAASPEPLAPPRDPTARCRRRECGYNPPVPGESDHGARYEARREAAPVAVLAAVVLLALAVSWREGWELHFVGWWAWVVLALPAVVLSLDLSFGPRLSFVRTQTAAEVLSAIVVAGNLVGVVVLVSALVAEGDELGADSSCSRPRPSGSRTSRSSGWAGSSTTAGRSSVADTSGGRRTRLYRTPTPRSPGKGGCRGSGTTCTCP